MGSRQYFHEHVYALVMQVPYGHVASYGMIASLLPHVTARMVGYAMAATPVGADIPWQRVINSAGKISARAGSDGEGDNRQRAALESEGIVFTKSGRVSWADVRWQGPDETWLNAAGIDVMDFLDKRTTWPT